MSSPIIRQSISGQSSTGSGSAVDALGHFQTGLFVATDSSPTSLTVQLEVTPDGNAWAVAEDAGDGNIEITDTDLDSNNNAHVKTEGLFARQLRANITAYDAAGNVDAWVMTAGNTGQGRKPTARSGPVTNL